MLATSNCNSRCASTRLTRAMMHTAGQDNGASAEITVIGARAYRKQRRRVAPCTVKAEKVTRDVSVSMHATAQPWYSVIACTPFFHRQISRTHHLSYDLDCKRASLVSSIFSIDYLFSLQETSAGRRTACPSVKRHAFFSLLLGSDGGFLAMHCIIDKLLTGWRKRQYLQ